jgi:lipopolysaccharide transport system permease protein
MATTIYQAGSELRQPRRFWRAARADALLAWRLAGRLLQRNLRARFRVSLLGYVWLMLPPLVMALIWIGLHRARVVRFAETGTPYPVYVLAGVFLWQGFVKMLQVPLQLWARSKHLLTRVRFPWEALLLAGVGEAAVEFVVYLAVLFITLLVFGVPLHLTMLAGLPAVCALLLGGLTVGLLLAPWAALYEDIGQGVNVGLSLSFFLVPVFYPTPTTGGAVWLVRLNPAAILLVTTRDLLTTGRTDFVFPFVFICFALVPLFLAAWLICRVAVPHLVARLGS